MIENLLRKGFSAGIAQVTLQALFVDRQLSSWLLCLREQNCENAGNMFSFVLVLQWMTTNLKPVEDVNGSKNPGLSWVFNLDGIASMYQSYEDTNLWYDARDL